MNGLGAYEQRDLFGYFASFLVFTTFYMRRMIPLRLIAIASNIAFITYAWLDNLTPILILHGALLPLNLFRLVELQCLVAKVIKASTEQFSIDALLPLMQRRFVREKDVLFKADDPAHALFYVLERTLYLPEIDKEMGPVRSSASSRFSRVQADELRRRSPRPIASSWL